MLSLVANAVSFWWFSLPNSRTYDPPFRIAVARVLPSLIRSRDPGLEAIQMPLSSSLETDSRLVLRSGIYRTFWIVIGLGIVDSLGVIRQFLRHGKESLFR